MKNITIGLVVLIGIFVAHIPMSFGVVDITPKISTGVEYTDNLNLTKEDKEDEFITVLSPGATINFRGRSANLAISYNPTYAKYAEFDENDGWRHLADLDANLALGRRTNLQLTDTFLFTEDPASETDTTIRRDRQVYYTNNADISLSHEFGRRDSFNLGYRHEILVNEDDTLSDTQDHTPYLGIEYWILPGNLGVELGGYYTLGLVEDNELEEGEDYRTAKGWVRLNKQLTRHLIGFVKYTHIDQDFDGEAEDYQVYNPALGIDYQGDEKTRISISVGYFIRDFEESDTEGSVSVEGDIAKTWSGKRTTLSIYAASGYDETLVSAEQLGFTFYTAGEGELGYRFTRRLSGNIFAAVTRNEYLDSEDDRIDTLTKAGAGFGWQVLSWLGSNLTYTYSTLNSTSDDNEYTENRILLGVTLQPERPFSFPR